MGNNIIDVNIKTTDDTFTIYGCGIFNESSKKLNRAEASILYIELHKWLFPDELKEKE